MNNPTTEKKQRKIGHVRTYSNSIQPRKFGRSFGIHEEQGMRRTMEDNYVALPSSSLGLHNCDGIYMICDGHGGDKCSEFVADNLVNIICKHELFGIDMTKVLLDSFNTVEDEWFKYSKLNELDGGSTALIAIFIGTTMYIGNCGDSEAILCRNSKAIPVSTVHNMKKNHSEEKRVLKEGGKVINKRIGHPIYNPNFFNIGVTRAIGDGMYKLPECTNNKPSGLIPTPDIHVEQLHDSDEFLILACDGLWDVVNYQEAVDIVLDERKLGSSWTISSKKLCDIALKKGSYDNITTLIVGFS